MLTTTPGAFRHNLLNIKDEIFDVGIATIIDGNFKDRWLTNYHG